jgi:hypothetical protein
VQADKASKPTSVKHPTMAKYFVVIGTSPFQYKRQAYPKDEKSIKKFQIRQKKWRQAGDLPPLCVDYELKSK